MLFFVGRANDRSTRELPTRDLETREWVILFRRRLSALGHVEGKTILIDELYR